MDAVRNQIEHCLAHAKAYQDLAASAQKKGWRAARTEWQREADRWFQLALEVETRSGRAIGPAHPDQ